MAKNKSFLMYFKDEIRIKKKLLSAARLKNLAAAMGTHMSIYMVKR
jgi:hypothetical protein